MVLIKIAAFNQKTEKMTKYHTLESKTKKKTTFDKFVFPDCITDIVCSAEDYKNVLHIGKDRIYRDVFKAWDDDKENFTIFFGTKGDEFND